MLALLALQAGRVVTSDTLCDLIWDEDQPASPIATLQSLVSRLRAALDSASGGMAEAGRDVLLTRDPGWVLDIDPAAVDALRFQELVARARQRSGRGEADTAAADLSEAIALWRGAALVDVVDAGYLAPHATRLNEGRVDAIEELAEAELAIGRPSEALARLEAHVEAYPLRERGWGLLMVALYRLGRQAAALGAFQQVRAVLREELGLDPSPELVEIEQRILRHDPTLGRAVATSVQATQGGHGEFAGYSVVVVEDHDFQRRTVVHLLRNLGVGNVVDVPDATQALQVLQAGTPPDVIVCDIDMPGMDGVEFVTRVAERNLASAVIIASGLESEVVRAVEAIGQSKGLHVLAALEKPLTARRLSEALQQYTPLTRERGTPMDSVSVSGEDARKALDNGELTARFEPRIDLTTGAFSGVEAGGHWQGAGGSLIPASVFVPALTSEGLLLRYVERLFAESCRLLDEARQSGVDAVRAAVNVSLLPLADASLADRVAEMVRSRGLDPRRFVCEVDDVALVRAPPTAMQVLTRLRVKGFGLSMSVGSAGPSWPHQLDRIPVNELKLDRRLVTAAAADPKRFVVLESALASARDMKTPVVAGGCDSRADFDTLVALGCSEAQGQFVAESMPAEDILSWTLAGSQPRGLVVS